MRGPFFRASGAQGSYIDVRINYLCMFVNLLEHGDLFFKPSGPQQHGVLVERDINIKLFAGSASGLFKPNKK